VTADGDELPDVVGSAGLVPFLFGVSGLERLPGTALVRLLGDLGVGTSAARTVIARLRTSGDLLSERVGREAMYTLAGRMNEAFERIRDDPAPHAWDGVFHGVLFNVPESARSYRDRLRRLARNDGYAPLRAGLLIHPYERWPQLSAALPPCPAGATVYPLQLRFSLADARTITAAAWELPRRAAECRTATEALERDVSAVPADLSGVAALRLLVDCLRRPMSMLLSDPRLPPVLLPGDWPFHQLRHGIEAAEARLTGRARDYAAAVADRPGVSPRAARP